MASSIEELQQLWGNSALSKTAGGIRFGIAAAASLLAGGSSGLLCWRGTVQYPTSGQFSELVRSTFWYFQTCSGYSRAVLLDKQLRNDISEEWRYIMSACSARVIKNKTI